MVRSLYACIVRLHPKRFRERFGEEMLCTFEEAVRNRGAASLVADGCLSLVRQWAFRSEPEQEPVPAAVSEVPLFSTADSSMPGTGALVEGVLLSVLAFAAVSMSIGHWRGPRVIHYTGGWTLFGEFQQETPRDPGPPAIRQAVEATRDWFRDLPSLLKAAPPKPGTAAPAAEAANPAKPSAIPVRVSAAALRRLPAAQVALIMAALDTNRDGKITNEEWQDLWKLLERADVNKDGVVTLEELSAAQ